jgi:5-methyltetrahydrofolate--homocysteine methyltransferase
MGVDAVESKYFGCNLVSIGNYYIADKIRDLALRGAAIAKRVGSSWASKRRVTP